MEVCMITFTGSFWSVLLFPVKVHYCLASCIGYIFIHWKGFYGELYDTFLFDFFFFFFFFACLLSLLCRFIICLSSLPLSSISFLLFPLCAVLFLFVPRLSPFFCVDSGFTSFTFLTVLLGFVYVGWCLLFCLICFKDGRVGEETRWCKIAVPGLGMPSNFLYMLLWPVLCHVFCARKELCSH